MLHNICFPYFIMMNEVLKKPCEDLFSFLRVVGTAQRRNISVCEPEETVRKKNKNAATRVTHLQMSLISSTQWLVSALNLQTKSTRLFDGILFRPGSL